MTNRVLIHPTICEFLSVLLSLLCLRSFGAYGSYINVLDLGANSDGTADASAALSEAWSAACRSTSPSTIHVPRGRYLVKGTLRFNGPCSNKAITVLIDGTIVAPPDYDGDRNYWLLFQNTDGVTVSGGTLDGRGTALWACKKSGHDNCPTGATTLGIVKSKNIAITGLTSLNSQMFHIVINGCEKVRLRGVKVSASGDSPNTDGIHVQLSTGVSIVNSLIATGDDCVSIGPGTSNLWIESVACGPGHGISIGSLGKDYDEAGVQNVTVKRVRFKNTQNGVRIKTWGRPSKGFVRNVVFQHAIMINVQNPIVIDQNYCPYNKDCPRQLSGVKISDVTYEDIQGTSATEVAVKFDCSKGSPCERIRMDNVNLSYKNREPQASCSNAAGSVSGLVEPTSCLY